MTRSSISIKSSFISLFHRMTDFTNKRQFHNEERKNLTQYEVRLCIGVFFIVGIFSFHITNVFNTPKKAKKNIFRNEIEQFKKKEKLIKLIIDIVTTQHHFEQK